MGVPSETLYQQDWTQGAIAQLPDYCNIDGGPHATYRVIHHSADSDSRPLSSTVSVANEGIFQESNVPSANGIECEEYSLYLPNSRHDSSHTKLHGSAQTPRKDIEAKARRKNRLNHHNLRNLLTGLDPKLSFRGQADVMHAAAQMIRSQYEHILRLEKLLDQTRHA